MLLVHLLTSFFVFGILLARYFNLPLWLLVVSGIVSLLFTVFSFTGRQESIQKKNENLIFGIGLLFSIFFISSLHYKLDTNIYENSLLKPKYKTIVPTFTGVIITSPSSTPTNPQQITFNINLRTVIFPFTQPTKATGNVQVLTSSFRKDLPSVGDLIEARGFFSDVSALPENFTHYYRSHKIIGRLKIPYEIKIKVLEKNRLNPFTHLAFKLKTKIISNISSSFTPEIAAVLKAMLIGETSAFNKDMMENFRKAGVIHILVVSGTNIGLLLLLLLNLRFLWQKNPIISFVIISGILLLYCVIASSGTSVIRATVMGIIYLGGLLLNRDYDAKTSLSLSALFLLILNPDNLFDIGFQLSFAACAGILFIYPTINSYFNPSAPTQNIPSVEQKKFFLTLSLPQFLNLLIFSPLLLSLCAQLPLFPILAYHFNQLSLVSIIANAIIVPLAGIIFPLSFIGIILSFIAIFFLDMITPCISALTALLLYFVKLFADFPLSNIPVASPSITFIAAYFLLLFAVIKLLQIVKQIYTETSSEIKQSLKKTLTTYLILLGILINLLVWSFIFKLPSNYLTVTFIDVGQGDSALIETPQSKIKILVDGGGIPAKLQQQQYDVGEKIVGKLLMKKGIKKLDIIILSHPDEDHLNGLLWILKNFRVDKIIDIAYPAAISTPTYAEFVDILKKKNIEFIIGRKDLTLNLDSKILIKFFHPTNEAVEIAEKSGEAEKTNNISLVFKLIFGKISFLFTGDIENEAEYYLVNQIFDLRSTILKVPHHGSNTSSSMEFLKSVVPQTAIISAGRNNIFGHPHQEILKRYESFGVSVYRTDECENIEIKSDGEKYFIKTAKHPP